MKALTRAHILGQERLRQVTVRALEGIWADLRGYDRENVPQWLRAAVPVVTAAQRQSVALTNGYLARAIEGRPVGVDVAALIGSAVRSGTPMDEVYTRPFVTHWTALKEGSPYEDALAAGLARATSMARMDVQLSMRATSDAVEQASDAIYGYQRVADAGACDFCLEVDGAYVKGSSGFVMALHNGCGCGLEPLAAPHRGAVKLPDGTEVRPFAYGPLNDKVAVHEHGEVGPVLASPDHDFTGSSDLA